MDSKPMSLKVVGPVKVTDEKSDTRMLSAVTDEPASPTAAGLKVKSGRSADHTLVEQAATRATDANTFLIGLELSDFMLVPSVSSKGTGRWPRLKAMFGNCTFMLPQTL